MVGTASSGGTFTVTSGDGHVTEIVGLTGKTIELLLDGDTYQYGADNLLITTSPLGSPPPFGGATPVPEPASWALMLAGFGLAGLRLNQKHNRSAAKPG